MQNEKLNQSFPIFWKGKLVKFINWDSLNFGGKLKIKVNKYFFEVDISELTNANDDNAGTQS